jgi:(2S)-methylsuccinyl-CoA dehydrogenase
MFLVEKPTYDGHEFAYQQEGGGTLSGKAIATIGYRGMHSFEMFFDDFFVPEENLLGGPEGEGKGFYFTMAGFSGGRIQTAARAVGVMQAAYERAVSYAKERVVFGRPIADYQLTQIKLARLATYLVASRQFTYAVGRLMDQGEGDMEASMVKLFTCKTAEWVTREAMQIHGGMGYAEETAVSRYFVDARVLSIFEGVEEILALKVIAPVLIKSAKDKQALED